MATARTVTESHVSAEKAHGDTEQKQRRRARTIVNESLIGVSTPLENRGVGHRLLPGLWQAAMNVVLSCLEADDVMVLIKDRWRGILGNGSNADSPIRSLGQRGMKSYLDEVEVSARTIMESLEAALGKLELEGLEDRFPETVFDAALQVLLPAWGPHHVRRALSEQSTLLIRGVNSACNFMEPVRLQPDPVPRKSQPEAAERPGPDAGRPACANQEDQSDLHSEPAPLRRKSARRVTAFASSDVATNGLAAWAAVMVCHDEDGRTETREISGKLIDPSGRLASINAVHECLLAACETASIASVVLETTSDRCVRAAIDGGTPGSRLPGEDEVWANIDRLHALHKIEIKYAERAVDRDLSERCDRLLRSLIEEE